MTGGSLGIRSSSYGSLDKQLQQQQHNGNGVLSSAPFPMQTNGRTKPAKMFKEKESLFHWIFKFAGRKKGEDAQDGGRPPTISLSDTSSLSRIENKTSFSQGIISTISLLPPPVAYFLGYTLPPGHPCNSFTLPPPPADKKELDHGEDPLSREGEFGGSDFGGYPTLKQRSDSYDIRESMRVHCGFVQGKRPGQNTGFDMDKIDLDAMEQCHGVVVASAIFGAFDDIQQPHNISEFSKKTICFFMFVDEETEAYLKNNSGLNDSRKIGIWRIVVVHNLPYTDGRRNGKVLVEENATFAISRHYRRFDVFIEAEANKAAGKYENASIDFQVEFYKKEGLTPYSEAKFPITSDVPEGCVVIREHVPISNLFTCLWFNEVDRFTSRDQISFSIVRDKIHEKTNWTVNMFLDCQRRNFVVQSPLAPLMEVRFRCNCTDQIVIKNAIFHGGLSQGGFTWRLLRMCLTRRLVVERRSSHKISELHKGHAYETCKADFHKLFEKYHRDVLEQMAHRPPVYPPSPPLLLAPPPPPPPPLLVDEPPLQTTLDTSTEKVIGAPVRRAPARRGRRSGSRRHRKVAAGDKETDAS